MARTRSTQYSPPLSTNLAPADLAPVSAQPREMCRASEAQNLARYADMFSAMGTEPRLRIMRLLLAAHPVGMVVGEIANELGMPASTLSHHLEKLKNEELVKVRRDGTYLWYSANTVVLQELLSFLYAECCTRNKAVKPESVLTTICT